MLGRSNYDCIWLAKIPPLLRIERVRARLELFPSVSPLKGVYCLVVPFIHDCLRLLVLAGKHPVYLVGSLL